MYWASVARDCGHWVPKVRDDFWAMSWVSCFYDTSCCFYDTSCCFYDTSMILLVKEREKCHFDNVLSISYITYYYKSEMRHWYFFREKISFVCKLLPIYEPFVCVLASKSSARRPNGFAIRCQKMFDHLHLGICNPHSFILHSILACCGFQICRSSIGYDLFWRRISNHKWLKDYFRHVAL